MKKIISTLLLSSILTIPNMVMAQSNANKTGTFKVNSTLTSTCSISANSVNFGAFMLPLSAQSSSGSINLLCSKQAPYTIDLAYGGVYGQGQTNADYWTLSSRNAFYSNGPHTYSKYSSSGVFIESKGVMDNVDNTGNIGRILGCTFTGNKCSTAKTSYDYGIMSGAAKGDKVAYAIYVPGDNSKVWNAGKNSYSGLGTGKEESLNFQAKIITAQSPNSFPTPDFYMDTVTATVTY